MAFDNAAHARKSHAESATAQAVGFWEAMQGSVVGIFLMTLAVAVLIRASGLFISVVDWDESLYALMADRWLAGALPYDAVWDQHSVGLPALFALILSVFPKSILALRLSACVAVAIVATTLYFAARMFDRRPIVPLIAVTLYIGWTSRLWGLAANTEIYLNALVAPAMYLLMREIVGVGDRRGTMMRMCVAALLFGLALQVKHVVIAEMALFFAVLGLDHLRQGRVPWRLGAAALACALLPTALVIAYFYANGLGGEYLRAVFDANLTYAASRPTVAEVLAGFPRSLVLIVAVAVAGAVMVVRRPSPIGLLVAGWAIAAGADIALPGQFWPHYFLLMAPPAALLGGVIAAQARFRWTAPRFGAAALIAALFANPIGIAKDAGKLYALGGSDAPREVSERIAPQLNPNGSIFVLNYQPVVYFLTDANLPTRHVFPADWSQRFLAVSELEPMSELDSVFRKEPTFVVFIEPDWMDMGDELLAAFHRHLDAAYVKDFDVADRQILPHPVPVQIYRRKSAAPEG